MIRTRGRMRLCLTMLILNLVFIWGNSLLPGSVSATISGWVKDLLARIFPAASENVSNGHGLLRKLAHLTEFACLGVCLCWLMSMLGHPTRYSLFCGFLVACLDETIQRFIPDRGPSFWDVLIDTAGVCLGMALLLAGNAIYQKKKNNKFLEENKQ